ncbi:MAG: bis(5'-nucleosyl)-tetraphosphatase (symmetrical) YqeK [Clostridiales bacterium]|nr:bis(5'-nucleosyl)-tetraphosphatase (symmetrical) YqeK [Clostridiales bacterium]HBM80059.1 phosphohydrolase [Clostridiaceae bacterium]
MKEEDIYLKLKSMISEERYNHSLGVQKTAVKLAKKYNADVAKASLAGLIHDCAKGFSTDELLKLAKEFKIGIKKIFVMQPELLHGPVGAYVARRDFGVNDEEILHSIEYHTTGCENMSMLDKIIYMADFIEPNRDFEGVEKLRTAAFEDIDKGVLLAIESTILYVINRGQLLDTLTVDARNFILCQNK